MPGELTLGDLETAVAEGAIDTVVVAQTDMQGRLMGKRFQAEFFLESGHGRPTAATTCSPPTTRWRRCRGSRRRAGRRATATT